MRSHAYLLTTSVTCALGVAYALSDGPLVEVEGQTISSRVLASSGSDDWFGITIALLMFALPLAAAVASYSRSIRHSTLLLIYCGASLGAAAMLWLVNLDSSLVNSVELGDRLLFLGVIVPSVSFFAFVADYVIATFNTTLSDRNAA